MHFRQSFSRRPFMQMTAEMLDVSVLGRDILCSLDFCKLSLGFVQQLSLHIQTGGFLCLYNTYYLSFFFSITYRSLLCFIRGERKSCSDICKRSSSHQLVSKVL